MATALPAKTSPQAPTLFAYRNILLAQYGQEGLRKGERTGLRIRAAACSLLEKLPLSSLKVQDICAHAEIAQGTFYQYFVDRDQLLALVLDDFVSFLKSRMLEATHGSHGHQRSVELTTRAYCQLFESNRGMMKCLLNHYEAFPQARTILQTLNTAWIETVVASLKKKRRAAPGSKTGDKELRRRCYALGGMVDQYLAYIYLHEDPDVTAVAGSLDDVVATLTFIWNQAFAHELAGAAG